MSPKVRVLAQGDDWCVSEYVCRAGPEHRPFQERHSYVTVAAVLSGTFQYRADCGSALLSPGAFMLGNHGVSFECGHEHGTGDHCIALHLAPDYYAEIARTAAGSGSYRFPTPMVAGIPRVLPHAAALEALALSGDSLRIAEAVPKVVTVLLGALSGVRQSSMSVNAHDARRVTRALRYIEESADTPVELDAMAKSAAMSKYHFLRVFTRLVGMTPHRWLLDVRLRRAAVRLAISDLPVSAIAFESGFGDLSTFNQRFRASFGRTPSVYRSEQRGGRDPASRDLQGR
jgi:AraC-like DNA-binding protein